MIRYWLFSVLFGLLAPFYYFWFRVTVKMWLRGKGLKEKRLKALTKGHRNFWWYEKVNEEVPLGFIYLLNKLFTILYAVFFALAVTLGYFRFMVPVISGLYALVSVIIAVMSVFSSLQGNICAYQKPFVLLRRTINNGYTSSVLDFCTAAIPLLTGCAHLLMTLNTLGVL